MSNNGDLVRYSSILAAFGVAFTLGARAAPFESPPEEPAAASLEAPMVAGPDFKIREPVESDGLMHHYIIDSRFGVFPAYGRGVLKNKVREVAALTQLAKISDIDVVAKTAVRQMQDEAKTVTQAVTNPIGLVTGIPKGIGHLFHGYKAQADEFTDSTKKSVGADASSASSLADDVRSDAKRYADRYLGVSAAERRYYQQLGLDPYTNNEVLRQVVHHLAKVEGATKLGLHFVAVPGIPYLNDVRRAMDAIYTEDPAVLRARQRTTLAGYGLNATEIARFENTLLLSPTRQALLEEAAKSLEGVAGRDELFRHAMGLTSEEEVQVFLQSTGLLVRLNAHRPVAAIVAGLRLPTAQFSDGRIAVLGAFDAVYWTEDVAGYEAALHAALPEGSGGLELWLGGTVSPAARTELSARGWEVHEKTLETLSEAGNL
jgi:hypothetical protein